MRHHKKYKRKGRIGLATLLALAGSGAAAETLPPLRVAPIATTARNRDRSSQHPSDRRRRSRVFARSSGCTARSGYTRSSNSAGHSAD
jgi:hypothetical protein